MTVIPQLQAKIAELTEALATRDGEWQKRMVELAEKHAKEEKELKEQHKEKLSTLSNTLSQTEREVRDLERELEDVRFGEADTRELRVRRELDYDLEKTLTKLLALIESYRRGETPDPIEVGLVSKEAEDILRFSLNGFRSHL